MNIVILNTSENKGGAAVACNRLHQALLENNIHSEMIVRQKYSNDVHVFEFSNSSIRKKINLFFFFLEIFILRYFKKKNKDFSLPYFGPSLSKNKKLLSADIIHIHWVQNSYISLNELEKIIKLNKPIVWTLHDMWAFTGGCHYNEDCRKFESQCIQCPQLTHTNLIDFSKIIFERKASINTDNVQIVCPSNWLMAEAKKSKLFSNNKIEVIPYNIDFNLFKHYNKQSALNEFGLKDDKKVILFVSMNVEDERKGFTYFKKAILHLEQSIPNWKNNYQILAIGRHSDEKHFDTQITYTGRLSNVEKISKAYSAAEVFVAPSLQDNLPNTVIESLACGTPVVAFNIGGMPDMIEHKTNGYLAKYLNVEDLSIGIDFCLNELVNSDISVQAQSKYHSKNIAEKYISLYKKTIECHSN